jgi:hypothetical protein
MHQNHLEILGWDSTACICNKVPHDNSCWSTDYSLRNIILCPALQVLQPQGLQISLKPNETNDPDVLEGCTSTIPLDR